MALKVLGRKAEGKESWFVYFNGRRNGLEKRSAEFLIHLIFWLTGSLSFDHLFISV